MDPYTKKLREHFQSSADSTFSTIVEGGEETDISWGELEIGCRNIIATLDEAVDGKGVVLIFLPHCQQLFSSFLGCMLGGYTPSFMPCLSAKQDPDIYWSSHQQLIRTIQPVAIVTNTATSQEMRAAGLDLGETKLLTLDNMSSELGDFVESKADDIALLQHSSGTTGLKKGVALTFDAIHRHSESYGNALNISSKDVIVSWLPLYHDMGLIACLITPAYHNIKTVQISAFEWLSRPNILFDKIEKHAGTLCWLPNFAFEHLSNILAKRADRFDLSSMRAFISCSEPCKAKTDNKFRNSFAKSGLRSEAIQRCYAMAETVFGVTQTDLGETAGILRIEATDLARGSQIILSKAESECIELVDCGVSLEGISIDIVDEERRLLPEGTIGEIAISGEFLFDSYNKEAERTQKVKPENTYYSSDLGFMKNGKLYVLGRLDDLIIVNGRNIYAHQIEELVSAVDGVKRGRAVAFSVFEEKAGSDVLVVMAEKELDSKISDQSILTSINGCIHTNLNVMPANVEILTPGNLIKTSSGKTSRSENRKRFLISKDQPPLKQAS